MQSNENIFQIVIITVFEVLFWEMQNLIRTLNKRKQLTIVMEDSS
jgi:hypothetical protein